MNLFLEIVLWIVLILILEPPLLYLFGKLEKKKPAEKENVNQKAFIMKYTTDMKGLTWVLGGFLGVPCLGLIIAFPFIYESNNMSKADVVLVICLFALCLAILIAFLMRVTLYKIEVTNGFICVRAIFKTKIIDLNKVESIIEDVNGAATRIFIYVNNKIVLRISNALTNFEAAKSLLKEMLSKEDVV